MKLVEVTVTTNALVEIENDCDVIKEVDKFVRDNFRDLLYPKGRFKLVGWKGSERRRGKVLFTKNENFL